MEERCYRFGAITNLTWDEVEMLRKHVREDDTDYSKVEMEIGDRLDSEE